MRKFARLLFQPCMPLGKDGKCATASKEHFELSRKAAADGAVLLKNNNNALPLKKGVKVALFGKSTLDYIKGGGGSGDVYTKYVRNIYEGMKIKESEGKVEIYEPLIEFYKKHVNSERERIDSEFPAKLDFVNRFWPRDTTEQAVARDYERAELCYKYQISEPKLPEELLQSAGKAADAAIVVFARYSSEGWDRITRKDVRDYYLSDEEEQLVEDVLSVFDTAVVVFNSSGVIDSNWFKEDGRISAALMAWQGGSEGGLAVADILCGDVNPSGKLTDTFAKSIDDYPSSETFNESYEYVNYTEDIYVGYRYFDTVPGAYDKVNYPFGFGLSYTKFELSDITACNVSNSITVSVCVKNIGEFAGREVVQLYYSAPQGVLGKPSRELGAFKKTRLLNPGESEKITLTIDSSDMASYDDLGKLQKSAYLLEGGEYFFYLGTSVRDTVKLDYSFVISEKYVVTKQLESHCAPSKLPKRMLSDGSFENLGNLEIKQKFVHSPEIDAKAPNEICMLDEVGKSITLDEFMVQLTDDELVDLLAGQDHTCVGNTSCFRGVDRLKIPYIPTADGPAGVRLHREVGIPTTAWPVGTALASTWDTDLLYEVGVACGTEIKENNLGIWLAPGMNIHRNPLCGRNFEYYSEDPLLTGKIAAGIVNGVQSLNVSVAIKHLACNNKEVNRLHCDSRVSERALREIYIKGFEICVKDASPHAIMTSYNKVNGVYLSTDLDMLGGIVRGEWDFDGIIITDWGNYGDHVEEVMAGSDIKMWFGYPEKIKEALSSGRLTKGDIQACVKRYMNFILNFD